MYCTVNDMRRLLPSNITIGDQNLGTPSPGRQEVKRDKMTPTEAIQYIRFAQQEIDSRLRPFYVVPLRRVKTYDTEILSNVAPGNNVKIRVHDSGAFAKEDAIRIQNSSMYETAEVKDVVDTTSITVVSVANSYVAEEATISVLEYPDPIPLVTARWAIAYAWNQLFSADQAPNISEFGKENNRLAINSLDSILSGTILLFGQDHTGKRFVRGSVFDAFANPTIDFQFGREKQ